MERCPAVGSKFPHPASRLLCAENTSWISSFRPWHVRCGSRKVFLMTYRIMEASAYIASIQGLVVATSVNCYEKTLHCIKTCHTASEDSTEQANYCSTLKELERDGVERLLQGQQYYRPFQGPQKIPSLGKKIRTVNIILQAKQPQCEARQLTQRRTANSIRLM
jgi:hypothetical protein